MNLYPAFLTDSVPELEEQFSRLQSVMDRIAGVHVDIIDGEFVDNITMSPIDLIGVDFGGLTVDFHLMTNDPINFVYECKQVENARTVIAQIERMDSQVGFIEECKEYGLAPGLSLDVYTPLESIDEESWQHITVLQLMTVKAGWQDQEYKQEVLKKVREAVAMKKKLDLPKLEILIDGGVNPHTIEKFADTGADAVTAGSALWESKDIEKTVGQLIL